MRAEADRVRCFVARQQKLFCQQTGNVPTLSQKLQEEEEEESMIMVSLLSFLGTILGRGRCVINYSIGAFHCLRQPDGWMDARTDWRENINMTNIQKNKKMDEQ